MYSAADLVQLNWEKEQVSFELIQAVRVRDW